jgi:hypothetical protein
MTPHTSTPKYLVATLFILLLSGITMGQHLADPDFKAQVEQPAYEKNSPRLMFDEAHNNFHTSTSRYKPFANLIMSDGYRLVINRQPFTRKTLDSFKLLVIVNALGDDIDEADAEKPAFTDEECSAVHDWVRSGGALLLIADPGAFAKSGANLAKQFGVEMSGNVTKDPSNSAEEFRPNMILYSNDNHLLLEHPITTGRNTQEKLGRVVVFSGQSLKGPQDSVGFLKLADSARDVNHGKDGTEPATDSARGTTQGLALKVGNGRLVVLGEADMLSALLGDPPEREPIGMNYPGIDNKQLALNVIHWLSGLLK